MTRCLSTRNILPIRYNCFEWIAVIYFATGGTPTETRDIVADLRVFALTLGICRHSCFAFRKSRFQISVQRPAIVVLLTPFRNTGILPYRRLRQLPSASFQPIILYHQSLNTFGNQHAHYQCYESLWLRNVILLDPCRGRVFLRIAAALPRSGLLSAAQSGSCMSAIPSLPVPYKRNDILVSFLSLSRYMPV